MTRFGSSHSSFPWFCSFLRPCFVIGLCFVVARVAYARDIRDSSTEREWSSTQYNALGSVGHMSEELVDTFFADPSLPAQRRNKFELQWSSVHLMYSQELANTIQDAQNLQSGAGDSEGTAQTVELLDKVRSLFGRNLGGAVNVTLLATRFEGFTLVPYLSGFVDGAADVPSWPRAKAEVDSYAGVGVGYGTTFQKVWGFGLNVRPGVRTYASIDASVSDAGDFSSGSSEGETTDAGSDLVKFGSGIYVPADLGGSYLMGKSTRFNLVMRNIGGAPTFSKIQGQEPPVYPMRISMGASTHFWEKGSHTIEGGTDLQDILGIAQTNAVWYRLQWAAQYLYRFGSRKETTFGLKSGLRSGYPSIGAFLDLYLFKIEGAYFTREAGYYPGQRPVPSLSFRAWSQMSF
jgi:hypothetical protein